ncbi:MAG TPA: META domain-containing protein, partial [Sphingomonas sp.]|nr:META domain-containing protein [Sphingomonas sp.]
PNIAFQRSVLSGTTGCNGFRGSYRVEGGAMIAGPLATTRRACQPPVNQQEQRLLALLGKRLTTSRNGDRLVLTAPNGQTLVLTPVPRR